MALLEVAAVCALERARWRRASRCRCSMLLSVAAGRTLQGDALGCGFRVTAVGTLRLLLEGAAVRVLCPLGMLAPLHGAAAGCCLKVVSECCVRFGAGNGAAAYRCRVLLHAAAGCCLRVLKVLLSEWPGALDQAAECCLRMLLSERCARFGLNMLVPVRVLLEGALFVPRQCLRVLLSKRCVPFQRGHAVPLQCLCRVRLEGSAFKVMLVPLQGAA